MDPKKKAKLEAAGWTFGSTQEFLNLSEAESAFVDLKIALSEALREKRAAGRLQVSPFHAVERLMGDMDRLWDGGLFSQTTAQSNTNSSDLYRSEDGKTYSMRVPVPGFTREQINIEVSKNHVSVDATRDVEDTPKGFQPLRLSLPDSLSYREQIPAHLDPSTAEAELKDGVLTITVSALTKEVKGSRITIK